MSGSRPVPRKAAWSEASKREAVLGQHSKPENYSLATEVPWGSGHGVGIGAGWRKVVQRI